MTEYRSTKTGNLLIRKPHMFFWRGQTFHGLVDVEDNSLYTDPEDDFSVAVGIRSSMKGGLIERDDNGGGKSE